MQATMDWLAVSGAAYRPSSSRVCYAHLRSYTAAYQEWGEGPPLVLVPGLAGGYDLLGPLARLLARNHRVISYQLRGEDDPFALRQRFGVGDLVDDLVEFIGHLGLERPAVMGTSFGGILALEFAARYPGRLRQLIVQGVGSRFEKGLLQMIAGWVLSCYPLPADSPFVNQFFNLLFGGRDRPLPLFDFVTRQCWQTDQSVMAHRFRLAERFDMTTRMGRVRTPTLLLAGERDMLVSGESLQRLHEGIAGSQVVMLPGSGHLAPVTHPRKVAEEVRDFLAR